MRKLTLLTFLFGCLIACTNEPQYVPDVMNGILFNARANGAAIRDVSVTETCAEATVSSVLRPDVMERYGIAPEVAGRFWDKFNPIASAFGLRFTRTRTADGHDRIRLEKP